MKKVGLMVLLIVMLVNSACVSNTSRLAQVSAEEDLSESSIFKGLTTKQVVQKLGKPQQKATDSKGNQIWEYKKPADQHKGLNTFVRISSFGLYSEEDAPYVDKLILTFAKGMVTKQEYMENVINISLPGLGGATTSQ